ncbi:MAG TPA: glycoside hydrolase family 3 C-terminal domain-containing protein, partial [Patescibacteria group bacterium]|nr:glycoside hydrolase family 3 C-terminal domain-containing protein [Patescibacteria group bacterium]
SLSPEDISAIDKVKAKSKKIIVIIVSGRPLDIEKYAKNWDAIIAAWLPGSEGQGVTDVLFGNFPFTGILPVDWEIY